MLPHDTDKGVGIENTFKEFRGLIHILEPRDQARRIRCWPKGECQIIFKDP